MRGIALIRVDETLDARRGLPNQILFDTLLWQAGMVLMVAALVWFAVHLVRPLPHRTWQRGLENCSTMRCTTRPWAAA